MELFAQVAGARVVARARSTSTRCPVERARIELRTSKVNRRPRDVAHGHRGGRRAHAARHRGVGLGRRAGRARPDVPSRPRARDRPGRGGGAPGRLRRRSAAPSRRPTEQVGALTPRAARPAAASPTRCVGAGLSEAITLPLVAPGDLARAGAPADRVVEAANPLRAEESVLRTRHPARVCCAPSPTTAPRASPTSRCSSSAGCSSLRPAARCCPTSRTTSRSRWRARCAGGRSRTTGRRRVRRRRRAARRRRRPRGRTTGGSRPRRGPASTRRRTAAVSVDGAEIGLVGEVDPRVVEALELVAPVVGARGRPRRAARRRPRATARSGRRRRTRRRGSTSRSWSPTPWRPTRWPRRCGPPAATSSRTSRCSTCSGPRRSAPAARASRSRVRYRAADRTLTDAEVAELREAAIAAVTGGHDAVLRG